MNHSRLIAHPSHPDQPERIPAGNIALVPACLLPYQTRWQTLANALPAGWVLVSLPPSCRDPAEKRWDDLVRSIQAMGHTVLVIPPEHLLLTTGVPDAAVHRPSDAPG